MLFRSHGRRRLRRGTPRKHRPPGTPSNIPRAPTLRPAAAQPWQHATGRPTRHAERQPQPTPRGPTRGPEARSATCFSFLRFSYISFFLTYFLLVSAFPRHLRPAQSPFPQGWRISVILKISALHPIQATRSGVFRGFLFSGPYPKAVNRHIINILIILHPFHPFSRNPRVSRDTLRGCGKSEYEPMI